MKQKAQIFLIFLLLFPLIAAAQKGKKKGAAKKKATPIVVEEDPRITQMLAATQCITFIDSIVIDSTQFMSAIHINAEEGHIISYDDFFHTEGHTQDFVYINELGNHCIFSMTNDSGFKQLYTSDLIGNQWVTPTPLNIIHANELFSDISFPYLMPDGQTLYFAARGSESLGGYDIYRTRYDAENERFLKPENIGMPFNSTADDYMYAICEIDSLGYFVTNRRQPAGKVCVYVFIPTESRKNYNLEAYSDDRLRSLARIDRIADTWIGKEAQREQALKRLEQASTVQDQKTAPPEFLFTINDTLTYTRFSDFLNRDNRDRMRELLAMRNQQHLLESALDKARRFYATASSNEKTQLSDEILQTENQLNQLFQETRQLEKEIRNSEIQTIRINTQRN